jgi:hypothetical protein
MHPHVSFTPTFVLCASNFIPRASFFVLQRLNCGPRQPVTSGKKKKASESALSPGMRLLHQLVGAQGVGGTNFSGGQALLSSGACRKVANLRSALSSLEPDPNQYNASKHQYAYILQCILHTNMPTSHMTVLASWTPMVPQME